MSLPAISVTRGCPGRPKDPGKRSAAMQAAMRLFVERGYSGTTIEAIARAAGVSKLTIYSHFGGKDALFREVVKAKCAEHALAELPSAEGQSPREVLIEIGRRVLTLLFSDEALRMYRMIIAESAVDVRLARLFHDTGPRPLLEHVQRLLRHWHEVGELSIDDPEEAASQLFSLLKGERHLRLLLGVAETPDAASVDAHLGRAVDAFLLLHGGCKAAASARLRASS